MKSRIFLDVVVLAAIFILPWWVGLILAAAGAFFFASYLELVFAVVIVDIMAGGSAVRVLGIPYFLTLLSVAAFFIIGRLRTRLRV